MTTAIKDKVLKGVSWQFIEKFGSYALNFIFSVILARLLSPKDFGLIGIITAFFVIAQVFIDSGFGNAYIQKKEVDKADKDTVFLVNIIISIIIYSILFFSAPLIADFYDIIILIDLIRVMGLILIINSFNIIHISQLTRDLDFKKKSKFTLLSVSISGILGVSMAYLSYGVWSLVFFQMSNRFILSLCLWISSRWKPAFVISKESFLSLFSFGGWLLLASLLRRIFDNIYTLTIGKFFSAAELGFFNESRRYKEYFSNNILDNLMKVFFPVLSKYQNDKEMLRNMMSKLVVNISFFMFPMLILLIIFAKPFVIIILTDKWAPMIEYLQLFCVVGLLAPVTKVSRYIILSLGKSKLLLKLGLLVNSLSIINIIISYRFGIYYIIIGIIIYALIAQLLYLFIINKLISYSLIKLFYDIKQIMISSSIIFIIGIFIQNILYDSMILTILYLALLLVVYIMYFYVFDKNQLINFRDMIVQSVKNI